MSGFVSGTLKLTLKYLLIGIATIAVGVILDSGILALGLLAGYVGYSQVVAKKKAEK